MIPQKKQPEEYIRNPPPKKTRHKVNSLWILPRLGQTGQSFPIETSAALKTKILPGVCQVPALYAETSLLIRKTVFRACDQPAASECHSSGHAANLPHQSVIYLLAFADTLRVTPEHENPRVLCGELFIFSNRRKNNAAFHKPQSVRFFQKNSCGCRK